MICRLGRVLQEPTSSSIFVKTIEICCIKVSCTLITCLALDGGDDSKKKTPIYTLLLKTYIKCLKSILRLGFFSMYKDEFSR